MVEGATESAFKRTLVTFLAGRLQGENLPKLEFRPCDCTLPRGRELKRQVELRLAPPHEADHVIAVTDVHTGAQPPEFTSAEDAIRKMRDWVGPNPRFHAHAAQHEFEAWLLPYWPTIQQIAGSNRAQPSGQPENVNHTSPPSARIKEAFRTGAKRIDYKKRIHGPKILENQDLLVAAAACPQLKALLNTIIHTICGQPPIP